MSWPAPKTASRSSASGTTTLSRTTTPTCRSSPTAFTRDGRASNPMRLTSPRRKDHARCRRLISIRPGPLPRRLSPRRSLRTRVEADFAVELGAEDETLDFPWAADDGGLRHYDLKRQPELLPEIEEARRVPELGEFLAAINSPSGILETAKCDVWSST